MNNNVKLDATIKRQKIILYTTLQILGIVAILLVGSSFDWLNMKFDINLVKTWNYWNAVIQQVLMYTLALIIGFIGRLEKEFLKNEDFHLQMNIYHAYFTQKTDSFTKFIDKIIKRLKMLNRIDVRRISHIVCPSSDIGHYDNHL